MTRIVMPGSFGTLLLRPDTLPDANPPLFPSLGPAQWCAQLHATEAEEARFHWVQFAKIEKSVYSEIFSNLLSCFYVIWTGEYGEDRGEGLCTGENIKTGQHQEMDRSVTVIAVVLRGWLMSMGQPYPTAEASVGVVSKDALVSYDFFLLHLISWRATLY